jgi:hypothetical protein
VLPEVMVPEVRMMAEVVVAPEVVPAEAMAAKVVPAEGVVATVMAPPGRER